MGRAADGTRKLRARNLGSREDPATGSAAAGLCSMLSLLGGVPGSTATKTRSFEVTQGVEMGRLSEIRVRVTVNAAWTGIEEVLISGDAVKILEGTGTVPIPSPETKVKPE